MTRFGPRWVRPGVVEAPKGAIPESGRAKAPDHPGFGRRLRREGDGSGLGECRAQLSQDREVHVQPHAGNAAGAEGQHGPLVLQPAELPLHGAALAVQVAPPVGGSATRVATSGLSRSTARVPLRGTVVLATEVLLLGPEPGLFPQRPAHLLGYLYGPIIRTGVTPSPGFATPFSPPRPGTLRDDRQPGQPQG